MAFTPFGSLGLLLRASPALFPYLLSMLASRAWAAKPRWQIYLFLVVLVAGGVVASLLSADLWVHLDRRELVGVYVVQTLLYATAGGLLLLNRPSPSNNRWRGP